MNVVNPNFVFPPMKTISQPYYIEYFNGEIKKQEYPSESDIIIFNIGNVLVNSYTRLFPFFIVNNSNINMVVSIEYENPDFKNILKFSLTPRRKTYFETLYSFIIIIRTIPPYQQYKVYPLLRYYDTDISEVKATFNSCFIEQSIQIKYEFKIISSIIQFNQPSQRDIVITSEINNLVIPLKYNKSKDDKIYILSITDWIAVNCGELELSDIDEIDLRSIKLNENSKLRFNRINKPSV